MAGNKKKYIGCRDYKHGHLPHEKPVGMIMETTDDYQAKNRIAMDAANPKVMEWERLMWKFQQALPWAKEGEKWVAMHRIFKLD